MAKNSDELNFESWAPKTKTTLIQKGLWDVVENGVPPDPSKNPKLSASIQPEELSKWRDIVVKYTKALQVLKSSLPNSVLRKTLSASSAKDAWDLLKNGNIAGSSSVARRGKCFQCGEQGHLAEEQVEVQYLMYREEALGEGTCDEDVWMVHPCGTMNHMTPNDKYFSALDRTHKAYVGLSDRTALRVEGRGDVKIMMKDGKKKKKKTIKNVLFVPGLKGNVLSIDQMIARGYSAKIEHPRKCTFHDRTGAVFGEPVWDGERTSSPFECGCR